MSWPCTECGACCAWYRVTFSETEVDRLGGCVPSRLVRPDGAGQVVFKGTEAPTPRCRSLTGVVGERVACAIYGERPTPCRSFEASWELEVPNPFCDEARFHHGLPPIERREWLAAG